jgi:conjugative transfer signal peptidase TraF
MSPRGPLALLSGGKVGVLILAGVAAIFHFAGLRVNASSSLPIGIYVTTGDPTANLVEFCPSEPYGSLSAVRGYRDRGTCPDGFEPLMKPVVATGGDIVDVSAKGIVINGRLMSNSAPRPFDVKGRSLVPWPFGRYRVAIGVVWVVSSFNSRSFDSRYFGPIPRSSIRSHLRPFLTE